MQVGVYVALSIYVGLSTGRVGPNLQGGISWRGIHVVWCSNKTETKVLRF